MAPFSQTSTALKSLPSSRQTVGRIAVTTGAGGGAREVLGGGHGVGDEARLEQQVVGEIAGEKQLGEQQDVSALPGSVGQRLFRQRQVLRDGADRGVELRERDAKTVGHLKNPRRENAARLIRSPR